MKIPVVNRETIERGLDLKGRFIVISLHDSDAQPAKVKKQPGLWAVLAMAIDDTDPALPHKLPTSIAMTEQHAAAIWDFVESHRSDVETIVVHCNHGYSRSPAVAAGLCKVLIGNDRQFSRGKDPNMHVYRMMVMLPHTHKDGFAGGCDAGGSAPDSPEICRFGPPADGAGAAAKSEHAVRNEQASRGKAGVPQRP